MILHNPPTVLLDYGRSGIELSFDRSIADWVVIEPGEKPAIRDFKRAFDISVRNPIASPPFTDIISPDDRIIIVTADGTRPVPNRLIIPAIIESCGLKPAHVTILIGSGSHRAHTPEELEDILGADIVKNCRIVNHNAYSNENLRFLGKTKSGIPISFNKAYFEADKRIVIGFIEPHFLAGYSGGAKGICPAICGIDTINAFHSYEIIAHPDSDYGILQGNPQQEAAQSVVSFAPPDFLINVTLNSSKQVTAVFSGHYIEAHRVGAAEVGKMAMVELEKEYPIVITTNSGYPLDQNLYQSVKGIWSAVRIVESGGAIIVVAECSRGIPENSNFASILNSASGVEALLKIISAQDRQTIDRWQVQRLAMALKKADIFLYSALNVKETEKCGMKKINNLSDDIKRIAIEYGPSPVIGVLPRGPSTIPLLKKETTSIL